MAMVVELGQPTRMEIDSCGPHTWRRIGLVRLKLPAGLRRVHTTVTDIQNSDQATVSDMEVCFRNLVDRLNAMNATAGTRGSVVKMNGGGMGLLPEDNRETES